MVFPGSSNWLGFQVLRGVFPRLLLVVLGRLAVVLPGSGQDFAYGSTGV